jgi:hypothetical protein
LNPVTNLGMNALDDADRKEEAAISERNLRDWNGGAWDQMVLRLVGFSGGAITTLLFSVVAYVFAMGSALSFPLSDPNMEYAVGRGLFWGVIGGLVVGAATATIPPRWRACFYFIGLASVLWVVVSSFWFFVHGVLIAGG